MDYGGEGRENMKLGIHDIGDKNLMWAMGKSDAPDLLKTLVRLSRSTFGFFTNTISRSFEYPFIVKNILEAKGKIFLDIGAGLSPLPIFLATQNADIVTVDNSSLTRDIEQSRLDWNEWGFLDYSFFCRNILSMNENIIATNFQNEYFDGIYSVSVIEHMPAYERKQLWPRLSSWLKKSGILLLTVDLIPDTDLLWNYSSGNLVEESELHGDLPSMLNELAMAGFLIKETAFLRAIPKSRTDIALLRFSK